MFFCISKQRPLPHWRAGRLRQVSASRFAPPAVSMSYVVFTMALFVSPAPRGQQSDLSPTKAQPWRAVLAGAIGLKSRISGEKPCRGGKVQPQAGLVSPVLTVRLALVGKLLAIDDHESKRPTGCRFSKGRVANHRAPTMAASDSTWPNLKPFRRPGKNSENFR